jgi:uncharacterized protein (DUF1697 family)
MTKYVALLRKVNVGGKNLLRMDQLRNAFEDAGLKNVRTFQAAGNIVFERRGVIVANSLEKLVSQTFNTDLRLLVFPLAELAKIVQEDPFKRIRSGDVMLCVVFLFDEPATLPKLPLKSTTDKLELIAVKDRAAFVVARRKQTGWFGFPNNFVEKQLGVTATTRQWSTVKKLIEFAQRLF